MLTLESSQKIYAEKIHQAIEYISAHISESISLETLSAEACFSPFHFHRLFTAYTGETPRDYIERMRLEKAANRLCLMPDKPVSDIAFECGYSSVSSFSRAFKKHYRISPSEFLNKHIHDFHSMNIPEKERMPVCKPGTIKHSGIEQLPAFHFIYTEKLNGYVEGIPGSWRLLLKLARAHRLIDKQTVFFGLPFDNPGITPRSKCRYRACLTVSASVVNTRGLFRTMDIDGGSYALFRFKGMRKDLFGAYAFIYGEWLQQSGYIPGDKPIIELYSPGMFGTRLAEVLEYTIALPVEPMPY